MLLAAVSLTPICDVICSAEVGTTHHGKSGAPPAAAGHEHHFHAAELSDGHPEEAAPAEAQFLMCAPQAATGCGPQFHAVSQNRPVEPVVTLAFAPQAAPLPAATPQSDVRPPGVDGQAPATTALQQHPLRI